MRRIRKNTRGQFVIIAALFIAVLPLSLAASIHGINLNRQELRYQPVQELILGVTSDLERALSHALSIASQRYYYSNRSASEAQAAANMGQQYISKWVRSAITAYSNLGLRITTQPSHDSFNFQSWTTTMGMSSVVADFNLDVDAYGFQGWVGRSAKYATLRILSEQVSMPSFERTITFQIEQSALSEDQGVPIPNLTNVQVGSIITGNNRIQGNVSGLTYLGGGKYRATFTPKVTGHTIGIFLTAITPEDNIIVSVERYDATTVELKSQEQNLNTQNLGNITLAGTDYTLPRNLPINAGSYGIRYTPSNSSYQFLNWTTTGLISVDDSDSWATTATIDGNGTITAFYRLVTQEMAFVAMDSREHNNFTRHLGTVTLNSTSYSPLPATSPPIQTGNYMIQYTPAPNCFFLRWETSGDVVIQNGNSNPTGLRVLGNGTATAVYYSQQELQNATVGFASSEDNGVSANLGKIRFNSTLFTLPNSTSAQNIVYPLEFQPAVGYVFLNWTTTGSVTVSNQFSILTNAIVDGDGEIKAFYIAPSPPSPVVLNLDSAQDNGATRSLGSITFDSTNYGLPAQITGLTTGSYPLHFEPANESYAFVMWEFSGEVIASDYYSSSTTVLVIGDGNITAVYGSQPPTFLEYSLSLESREEASSSTNLGNITLGATVFSLPNTVPVFNGTYLLRYTPVEGYVFVNWTTTENVLVQDVNSAVTVVIVRGNGSITAFYRGADVTFSSREWNDISFNLGTIRLNSSNLTLPAYERGLVAGSYAIQYLPPSGGYSFLRWETSGDVVVTQPLSSATVLAVFGNGNATAIYSFTPPPPLTVTVSLSSQEKTSASINLGTIRLGDNLFGLPNTTTIQSGAYVLEYAPAVGYVFLNWTTTGNISVQDPFSALTTVTLNGSGTIKAFYSDFTITLSSKDWNNTSTNLGRITLGSTSYLLPRTLTGLAGVDYQLMYSPLNSSYVFLWWESSGDAVVWNGTSSNTTVTIFGNGELTAVYQASSGPPPPPPGDWSTLYVDTKYQLLPGFMWSGRNGHLPSRASTGNDKQEAVMTSVPVPTLYLAQLVNVTAYIRPVPPGSAKEVYLEVGFTYEGHYYRLGDGTFLANARGEYFLMIDISHGEFTSEFGMGVLPEGSVISLKVIVTFYVPPNGFFFLYYGPSDPSRIDLF